MPEWEGGYATELPFSTVYREAGHGVTTLPTSKAEIGSETTDIAFAAYLV